jgi:hypothetical protein
MYFTKKRVWHALLHDPKLEKPRVPTKHKA